jgi:putative transcriptional regulator
MNKRVYMLVQCCGETWLYLTGLKRGIVAVYFGGDVGDGAVSLIHGRRDVTNSLEIRPGLYLGGMDCAKQMVTDGKAKPEEFKFFARYAGWGPGQLESEAERDVWYVAASAKELVLKPVIKLPKPLYREILELMGGEYSETARKAFSEDPSGENV